MSLLLTAVLPGCESVHVSGEPAHGGPLKKTVDVMAATAVGIWSTAKGGAVRNAWEDPGGTWHWTEIEHGVGTFRCEGRRLGMPERCDKIGP